MVRTIGVVVAAGAGTRLGASRPKALVPLAGKPLVAHAAGRLHAAGCDQLVIVAPADAVAAVSHAVFDAVDPAWPIMCGGHVCAGGDTRQASVARALGAVDPRKAEVVLVHDAARPLAPVPMIRSVIEAVRGGAHAVIPGLPVTDTIKRVADGAVVATVDRSELVAVQTPQGFDFPTLYRAHRAGRDAAADERTAVSDDAGLVERFGDVPVRVVPGDDRAMKITTAADLAFAEAMLASGAWA